MNFKRMWVLFVARNKEFIRDRAGFGWNILFPFLLVVGFGLVFGSGDRAEYKLGVFPIPDQAVELSELNIPQPIKQNPKIKLVPFESYEVALDKLTHHKVDLLIENNGTDATGKLEYWVTSSSPKGYVLEKIVKEAMVPDAVFDEKVVKKEIDSDQIRYIDWLFPGILGMNIMFSALYGVGYVIVRYRRTGVLKRLKATPVTAFEYLSSQLISRVLVLISTAFIVWIGCDLIFSFKMQGSYVDVLAVFTVGTICLISMGLVTACRGTNEEVINGIINFISWPMMFLSEVWFSIEGASPWIKHAAQFFPLTHFLTAARKIINDGAVLSDVSFEIAVLLIMSTVFLTIGSVLFSWTR